MIFIAHRGNTVGPNPERENSPEYLLKTLSAGYHVEVDVRKTPKGLFLGHNEALYKVESSFFRDRRIWTHCKNTAAFIELSKMPDVNCFLQEEDDVALTTAGYLWSHSRCTEQDRRTVVVCLDESWSPRNERLPYALCSDFIPKYISKPLTLPFNLLVVDIDGVMTDGTKMYDREGKVFGKAYCDLDFTAIKRFQAAGIKVCFLSGDTTVNKAMAETRKIPFFHNLPGVDKASMLGDLERTYGTDLVAYVGDDYYDISMMCAVPISFCPATSPLAVKRSAKFIVSVDAGKGVIAGIYDMFEKDIPHVFPRDSADVNPI